MKYKRICTNTRHILFHSLTYVPGPSPALIRNQRQFGKKTRSLIADEWEMPEDRKTNGWNRQNRTDKEMVSENLRLKMIPASSKFLYRQTVYLPEQEIIQVKFSDKGLFTSQFQSLFLFGKSGETFHYFRILDNGAEIRFFCLSMNSGRFYSDNGNRLIQ